MTGPAETATGWLAPQHHPSEVFDNNSGDVGDNFYELTRHPAAAAAHATGDDAQGRPHEPGAWLIFGDDTAATETLQGDLANFSQTCVLVRTGDKYANVGPSEYRLDPA